MDADSWQESAPETADYLPAGTPMCDSLNPDEPAKWACTCDHRPAGHVGKHRCRHGWTWGEA